MLAKNPTRKALGDTVLGNDMIHTGTAAGGAYQFPEAASLRISFSSVKSEDRTTQLPVLSLQLLEPLDLVALQATVFRAPAIVRYFRHTYRPNRFRDRTALRNQHINLPQLGDDLFRRVSLPCHSSVLHQAISHTSGRTTSQGADHHRLGAGAADCGEVNDQRGRDDE